MARIWRAGVLCCLAVFGCAKEVARTAVDVASVPGVPPVAISFDSVEAIRGAVESGAIQRVPEPGPVPESVVSTLGIPYVTRGADALVLDLYAPQSRTTSAPGLVFIHGGGWRGGSRSFYAAWCAHFAAKGYVCATIQYRFSDKVTFPGAVEDAMDAVRWMHEQADTIGVDREAIGVVGQSAGAHLALMAAYAPGVLSDMGEDSAAMPGIKAVAAFYPPTDFTVEGVRKLDPVQQFLGTRYATHPELYSLASPLSHVSGENPPTLLVHGTVDEIVPVDQSDRLFDALRLADVPCWYDRIEGWHHAMDLYVQAHDHCLGVLERFLETFLPVTK
ncbi:MAG: hypothetical protein AMXMBFR84_23260 [Candidatus Hydrogenedentota bacterium]